LLALIAKTSPIAYQFLLDDLANEDLQLNDFDYSAMFSGILEHDLDPSQAIPYLEKYLQNFKNGKADISSSNVRLALSILKKAGVSRQELEIQGMDFPELFQGENSGS
jgi:hypothetical protein